MIRLFIASPLPADILDRISRLQNETEKAFSGLIPWIPNKHLHLTWLFLGWAEERTIPQISNVLAALEESPLSIQITAFDYGPEEGPKRMLWLYLKELTTHDTPHMTHNVPHTENNKRQTAKLARIKRVLETELERRSAPFEKEHREFIPHINLARLKFFPSSTKLPEIRKQLDWKYIISEMHLYQSILKPTGAEYQILVSRKLGEERESDK